jgi:hypothetical protein
MSAPLHTSSVVRCEADTRTRVLSLAFNLGNPSFHVAHLRAPESAAPVTPQAKV